MKGPELWIDRIRSRSSGRILGIFNIIVRNLS